VAGLSLLPVREPEQFMQAKQDDDSHKRKSCGEVIVKVSLITAHTEYISKMHKACLG
jgi:hypothetical protein